MILPAPPASPAAVDPKAFGVDLLFNGNTVVNGKGDYTEIGGEENLRRAIMRRLVVVSGTYKYRPTYGVGLYSYLKKPLTKTVLDTLTHRIKDQLSQERRLEKIVTLTLTPMMFNNMPGLQIVLVVQAKGKKVAFQPLNFARQF